MPPSADVTGCPFARALSSPSCGMGPEAKGKATDLSGGEGLPNGQCPPMPEHSAESTVPTTALPEASDTVSDASATTASRVSSPQAVQVAQGEAEGERPQAKAQPKAQAQAEAGSGFLSRFAASDLSLLVKALLPFPSVLGLGALGAILLSCVLPLWVLLPLALALLLPPLLRTVLRLHGVMPNPDAAGVRLGGMTDAMEGEFCVFLLGSRNNNVFKLDKDFGMVGQAFQDMVRELEGMPASAGFLGVDSYVGSNVSHGSQVMAVTYWRSYEHLLQYTHDSARNHASVMRQLAHKLSKMPHIGLWHEAYIVKPGQHESLYFNCPPLGLGAASGLRPAKGPLSTSRGRVRASGPKDKDM